jgi:Na+-driven multidrug efflux pump
MKNIHLNLHNLLEIANGGMPSLFRQGLAALSALLLNRFANLYGGDPAIAGMSIVTRILMLNVSVLIGFGQGYQPICSYNYGGGRYQRVREGFFYCLRWGTVMMTVAGALCFLGAPEIVSWFRDDPKVITIGIQALRWQSAVLPLMATGVLTNMMLQSCGKGVIASITSSARNGIFFIPLILILPRLFGLTGVEMTQAWADVFTFLLCVPVAWRELQKMNQHSLDRDCERYSK